MRPLTSCFPCFIHNVFQICAKAKAMGPKEIIFTNEEDTNKVQSLLQIGFLHGFQEATACLRSHMVDHPGTIVNLQIGGLVRDAYQPMVSWCPLDWNLGSFKASFNHEEGCKNTAKSRYFKNLKNFIFVRMICLLNHHLGWGHVTTGSRINDSGVSLECSGLCCPNKNKTATKWDQEQATNVHPCKKHLQYTLQIHTNPIRRPNDRVWPQQTCDWLPRV